MKNTTYIVNDYKKEISYKDNAFDLLKIIAATIVLLSHSFRHFEIEKPVWSLFFTDGSVGVMMFFAISGFTIMPSWEKFSGKGWCGYFQFLFNRFIRIFPPILFSFIVLTIANASLKGIIPFSLDYLWYTFKYCFLFLDNGYKGIGISNGVLWTMCPTMLFYIVAPLLFMLMKDQKNYCMDFSDTCFMAI